MDKCENDKYHGDEGRNPCADRVQERIDRDEAMADEVLSDETQADHSGEIWDDLPTVPLIRDVVVLPNLGEFRK